MQGLYITTKINKYLDKYYYTHLHNTQSKPSTLNEIDKNNFIKQNNLSSPIQELQQNINNIFNNYNHVITRNLSSQPTIQYILNTLLQHSPNSYIVGGCVRDSILHITPKDYDFVTDIDYETLKTIFKDYKFQEIGQQFLVFNLIIDNISYEIANFRKEDTYIDGRRPAKVDIGTLEDDMNRRDFTINALYWNPLEGLIGQPLNIDDIISRTLRFIGDPLSRLEDDYLRGWRFYRLLKTKKLKADKKSLKAIRTYFEYLMKCNPQRVMVEIEKICL